MILFAWSGFPQYAARCIGAFVDAIGGRNEIMVVATRPKVPVEGMEKFCKCPVMWIHKDDSGDFIERLPCLPRTFVVNGWAITPFNLLRDRVRAAGGKVYAMVDNNYVFSFREMIKAVRFRMLLKRYYDGFLVPGKSGRQLLHFYGVPDERVQTGMYSADGSLFKCTFPIEGRPKRILFVGQLCERKNIVGFAKAFLSVDAKKRDGWVLDIYGCGPDKNLIPSDAAVKVHDFLQPEKLAALYSQARVFVLPSKDEHWGVVVHEAALSGCYLLVSRQVGAAKDFVESTNGRVFDAFSEVDMRASIVAALSLSIDELKAASRKSIELASSTSLESFASGVMKLIGVRPSSKPNG